MRLLVIENYPDTPLGLVGETLAARGLSATIIAAHAGDPVPETPADHAGLIVLGGEQTAVSDDAYPFLPRVCDLIRSFHDIDRPVLGICLGSQLIARAFGGENILGRPVEFGWHEVRPTSAGREDPVVSTLGVRAPLFHWHSDTVSLPPEAVHLASSDQTPVQAFRVGRATYGLQFHFEAGEAVVRHWSTRFAGSIAHHAPDWPDRLESELARQGQEAARVGTSIAGAWLDLLAG